MPHSAQNQCFNNRPLSLALVYDAGIPHVMRKAPSRTASETTTALPLLPWQSVQRQQAKVSRGGSLTTYRIAPHWQPPSRGKVRPSAHHGPLFGTCFVLLAGIRPARPCNRTACEMSGFDSLLISIRARVSLNCEEEVNSPGHSLHLICGSLEGIMSNRVVTNRVMRRPIHGIWLGPLAILLASSGGGGGVSVELRGQQLQCALTSRRYTSCVRHDQ